MKGWEGEQDGSAEITKLQCYCKYTERIGAKCLGLCEAITILCCLKHMHNFSDIQRQSCKCHNQVYNDVETHTVDETPCEVYWIYFNIVSAKFPNPWANYKPSQSHSV